MGFIFLSFYVGAKRWIVLIVRHRTKDGVFKKTLGKLANQVKGYLQEVKYYPTVYL